MKFAYEVLDSENKRQRGVVEAGSLREASKLLLEQGFFIKTIKPRGRAKRGFREVNIGGVRLLERALFTKHLAMMMKSGISLNESLESILEQTPNHAFKRIIKSLLERLRAGQSLASSMKRYPKVFNDLYVNIVRIGEQSGTLEENLEYLAEHLEDQLELRRNIRAASLYPMVILSSAFVLVLVLTYFVLPRITKLFQTLNVELPLTTRILLWVSSVMEQHGALVIFGTIGVLVGLRFLLTRKGIHPFSHRVVLRLPVVGGIVTHYNLATINRTLAILLRAGITIDQAISITADTTRNYVYRRRLRRAYEQIQKGKSFSSILQATNNSQRSPLFPLLMTKMISVGERSGRLDESFGYVAEYFEREVDNAMKNLTTTLEPILLLTIGLGVGLIAISIITPIYQITGQIRR